MAFFVNTIVLPDDANGFGVWLLSHYYEHLQFVTLGMRQSPPVFVPDYAVQSWSDDTAIIKQWLAAHQSIHDALRHWTGVQGIDLSTVDTDDQGAFFEWMDVHGTEHSLIRQALGIT